MGCNDSIINSSNSRQLERPRYFARQLITANDLMQEQNYLIEKHRRHNRMFHGWGIVCGLEVSANPLGGAPMNVAISPGYALSPQGDEIYVPNELQFNLELCIKRRESPCASPCGSAVSTSASSSIPFYIAIRYTECLSNPVRVSPLGCGCDETACEYSRIRDSFELNCLQDEPLHDDSSCIECPSDPWVVLAQYVGNNEFDVSMRRIIER